MDNSAQALRRWWGVFCLAMAAGMLIWGQTLLQPHLQGAVFIVYWFFCFVFTLGAIVIALIDVRAVRRQVRAEHRALLERAIEEVSAEEEKKPADRGK